MILNNTEARNAIQRSLPGIESNDIDDERLPFSYVPPSHARAIAPEATLVEGMRGAGKSFWWNALRNDKFRNFIVSAFPEANWNSNITLGQGYGENFSSNLFPDKDTIKKISLTHDGRDIWRAVIAVNIQFSNPFPISGNWEERIDWVGKHPEEYRNLIINIDKKNRESNKSNMILFDALDRLASDWITLRPLARSLFQLALDLRDYRSIKLKLFVRPDMIEDRQIFEFPDASKLKSQRVSLKWNKADLYALFFVCLANDSQYGQEFRNFVEEKYRLKWERELNLKAWILPKDLRGDEAKQRDLFHDITGPAMASGSTGNKKGIPYTWLPNHLADLRGQVSPRSFLRALREAARYDDSGGWDFPIHFNGLKQGVQEASKIRVDETAEDYPWVKDVMEQLKGLTVPCQTDVFINRWQERNTINELKNKPPDKLPPSYLDEGERGLLKDLKELGFIDLQSGDRIQMPDVYRIAFGLGRKGGVKPVK